MTLFLKNLRNLTTLYAHLPQTDIFFAEVLRKAVESRGDQPLKSCPPLHRLREANLEIAWNYREDSLLMIITIFSSTICGLYSVAKHLEVISH
jgi:hypothetical protein